MSKIPSKSLPRSLKDLLKHNGFNKREIEVKIDNSTRVSGSNHAPEYDNFDYGYTVMLNMGGGNPVSLQTGMSPNDSKTVALNKGEVVIDGDKHAHYATLTMTQETFNDYFQQTKAASLEGPFTIVIPVYNDEYDDHPAEKRKFPVKTLEEASKVYQRERDHSGMGASTFGSGSILKGSKEVAYVSYNGRVWEGKKNSGGRLLHEARLNSEISSLESRIAGDNALEDIATSIETLEKAVKNLDNSFHAKKLKEDLKHLHHDYDELMKEIMQQVEPIY